MGWQWHQLTISKSRAPCSKQTTTPAPRHLIFYRLDALPDAQPTVSKHWRQETHPRWYTKMLLISMICVVDEQSSLLVSPVKLSVAESLWSLLLVPGMKPYWFSVPGEYFLVSRKLDTFCYLTVQTAPCYVQSFWHNTGVWQADGWTELL